MRSLKILLRSMLFSGLAVALLAVPAWAQTPSAKPKGGLCAPWHSCVAKAFLGMIVLYILFVALGYMIQRKGFDKVEHRQGSPDGVSVDKK